MTIIESLRAWLRAYPPLASGRLGVDFLPEKAKAYSVDTVPCKEVVKPYLDGSCVKQYLFTLASREFRADDIRENTENLAFYEAFSRWVEDQNRHPRRLPELGGGRTAQRVEVTTSGYPFLVDGHGTARYQIQMKLTYFQKGAR